MLYTNYIQHGKVLLNFCLVYAFFINDGSTSSESIKAVFTYSVYTSKHNPIKC